MYSKNVVSMRKSLKDGQKVRIVSSSIDSTGEVVGLSQQLPSGQVVYLVKITDGSLPNDFYPYSTVTTQQGKPMWLSLKNLYLLLIDP